MISPALIGTPHSGLTSNEFKQLISELEIVVTNKTYPITDVPKNLLGKEVFSRLVRVHYNFREGNFSYGIRDYVEDPKNSGTLIDIKEATYSSLNIWEEFVPKKYRKELYEYDK